MARTWQHDRGGTGHPRRSQDREMQVWNGWPEKSGGIGQPVCTGQRGEDWSKHDSMYSWDRHRQDRRAGEGHPDRTNRVRTTMAWQYSQGRTAWTGQTGDGSA